MTDVDELIERARGGDEAAATALAGDPDGLPAVLDALARGGPTGLLPSVVVRLARPDTVPLLIERMAVDQVDVRWACVAGLGASGDPRALDALLAELDDESWYEPDRSMVAQALGDFGDPAAVGPLQAVVAANRREYDETENPALLLRAAEALAKLGDHGACDAVLEILASPSEMGRSLAATVLRLVTGPGVVEALARAATRDRSREVRAAAVDPLALLGTPEAVEALVPVCQDDVDDVAVRAHVRLGGVLGETFDDEDGEEEAAAAWAEHRDDFRPATVHRMGRPLHVPALVDLLEAESDPGPRDDLVTELTLITGLPVAAILRDGGVDALRRRVDAGPFEDGGLYKWGHAVPFP
ncbi:MAG TPA: HEAT repeat domain-containing protein [Acidimicrobiales bacterium]